MTPREVMYRIGQLLTLLSMRVEFMLGIRAARSPFAANPASFQFCRGPSARLPALTFDVVGLNQAKARIMRGDALVAGKVWQWQDTADIWHRAPDTGRTWPSEFFGSISFREGNPYGDVRQLWEPSRLQHLMDLAMLSRTEGATERKRAAQMATAQLRSWCMKNPPLSGAHYISSMECALRIISVCHALDILRGDLEDASWEALLRIAARHAPFIERRLSLHSSTGNHTVAEAAGLVYAGLLFPEMKGSQRWFNKGVSILTEAASTQVLPDGGGLEQALWYHHFNIQLLSLVEALLRHSDREPPPEISSAVDRGNRFLEAMGLDGGWLPPIGDSDDGHALSRYLQLPAFAVAPQQHVHTFPTSGYTIAQTGRSPDAKIIFDHGPLGMPPTYGHGHADALSLILRLDNEDVFIDPGTYTYTGNQAWRRYFRSTRAHNTVTVGGKDQARQEGCFLWSKPFRAALVDADLDGDAGGRLLAAHDGYRAAGVRHLRGIAWASDQWLLVWDGVFGVGVQELELNWHLARQPASYDSGSFELPVSGGALAIRCNGGAISTHRGEQNPMGGWHSPHYGRSGPITTVRVYYHGTLPHAFTTLVALPGGRLPGKAAEDALKWMNERAG